MLSAASSISLSGFYRELLPAALALRLSGLMGSVFNCKGATGEHFVHQTDGRYFSPNQTPNNQFVGALDGEAYSAKHHLHIAGLSSLPGLHLLCKCWLLLVQQARCQMLRY